MKAASKNKGLKRAMAGGAVDWNKGVPVGGWAEGNGNVFTYWICQRWRCDVFSVFL